MKNRILIMGLAGVAILAFFTFAINAFQKEFTTSPGQELNINLKAGGNMTITGWDQNKVAINVQFSNGNPNDWNIEVTELATGMAFKSDYAANKNAKNQHATYQFMVPKQYNLKLDSSGGAITIKGVSGNFSGKTQGGNLVLSQLKGMINLKTMGGDISLRDSDMDGKLKTMGGRIILENVTGDIIDTSMGGPVIHKNVKSRSGETTGDVVNITTMGGDIHVSEAPHGANVNTHGGDILIKSAKEFVLAKTMGGKITVQDISGWIHAEAMSGDVTVTMTGDPKIGKRDVQLSSMGGNVTLTVPADLSMAINIQVGYTKKSHQNYTIHSDFDIQLDKTDSWDTSHGSPLKYIHGQGNINGGTHQIMIKTINGNVFLKKNRSVQTSINK